MSIQVNVIFAVARDGGIGLNGKMPWNAPGDLKQFKDATQGDAVIMGRLTWDSLGGRPLRERANFVVSSQTLSLAPVVFHGDEWPNRVSSLAEGIQTADEKGYETVWVIGGARLIEEALPLAKVVRITAMKHDYETDVKIKMSSLQRLFANRVSVNELKELETDLFQVFEYTMG